MDNLWDKRQDLLLELDQIERTILQNAGWKNTSRTPNYTWRWRKEIDGIIYMCSEEDALRIQEAVDFR